jgi:phage-related protein
MGWSVAFHDSARREYRTLPLDMQGRLERLIEMVERHGLDGLSSKDSKYLGDGLWEFRVTGRDGIARALYVKQPGQSLVIVCAFVKKTQKTPAREIRLARSRATEV